MNVSILCPGPSLCQENNFDDVIIGINRAAIMRAVDYWVALDWVNGIGDGGIINWHKRVLGFPDIVTSIDSRDSLKRRGFSWPASILSIEESWKILDPTKYRFSLYSATSAIVYAVYLGATKINIYGMDMQGTKDADGIEAGSNRSDERWKMESEILHNVINAFPQIEIKRINNVK